MIAATRYATVAALFAAEPHLANDDVCRATQAKEPSNRWRNWWKSLRPATVWCGNCRTYPSKDVAESFAARASVDEEFIFVGAFSVEERP